MKLAMPTLPFGGRSLLPLVAQPGRLIEAVQRHDDALLPDSIALLNGLAHGDFIDPATRIGEFLQIGQAHRGHPEASLVVLVYEPLSGETVEGFPHGTAAGAQQLAQGVHTEPFARTKFTCSECL